MVNIKKEIKEQLEKDFTMKKLSILKKEEDTLVFKYLFELEDQNKIEAVLMQHDYGNSLCISTQVGCNMGCSFCESGRLKKRRNLETYEMVLQILMIEEDLHLKIIDFEENEELNGIISEYYDALSEYIRSYNFSVFFQTRLFI